MKKHLNLSLYLIVIILSGFIAIHAQDADNQRIEMVDLKMDLAETKLELLDSRIRLMEEKPALMEMKLREIETSIDQLSFSPEEFNVKYRLLDSLMEEQQSLIEEQQSLMEEQQSLMENQTLAISEPVTKHDFALDPMIPPPGKYVISIHPIRLFEGTLQLSIERVLNQGNSIELSAMATYATKEGIANYYVSNQSLSYYNVELADYTSYESENISGFGGSLSWRNYLLPGTKPNYAAPRGPYVSPIVMYRRLILSGFDQVYNEEENKTEAVEVVQYLNVFSGGFIAGWQFVLWKAISADVYVGGMMRLSKYDGDTHFTKYKQLPNIDFSGVIPNFGIKIGVVK